MDTTAIAVRLSAIRKCVNALIELRRLTYEEFAHEHILVAAAERDLQIAIQAAMAKFRNVLLHLYVEVDTTRVYHYIQSNLADFETFAHHVSTWLQSHDTEGA